MSKKGIVGIVILVLVGFGVWYYFRSQKTVEENREIVKIGVIMPLTGSVAQFGKWAKNGIELFEDNNKDNKIVFIFEDSKFDAKTGINVFNKLIEVDDVDAVIVGMSKVAIPIIPVAKQNNIPLLMQDVTFPDITSKYTKSLRHFIQSDREGKILAKYATTTIGLKTFGILTVQDEAGIAASNSFETHLNNMGKILERRSFENNTTDFKSIVQPILRKNPDAIYVFGNGPSWANAIKTIRELGYKGVILTNTAMYIVPFRNIVGKAANGIYFTYPYIDENSKTGAKFVKNYNEVFGEFPSIEAAYAFDLANIIHLASQKAKNDNSIFNNTLFEIQSFSGAYGEITIPKNRDIYTSIAVGLIQGDTISVKKIIKKRL